MIFIFCITLKLTSLTRANFLIQLRGKKYTSIPLNEKLLKSSQKNVDHYSHAPIGCGKFS